MRGIGALLFCLFALAGSGPAFSYGSVAIGNRPNSPEQDYVVIYNEPSAEIARTKAFAECNSRLQGCKIAHDFVDSWVSIVRSTFAGKLYVASSTNPDDAQKTAKYFCSLSIDESYCRMAGPPLWLDKTSVVQVQPRAPPPAETQNTPAPPRAKPPVAVPTPSPTIVPPPPPSVQKAAPSIVLTETGIIEFRYLTYLSFGILALLFMWLLWALSIRTPPAVLHTYLLVAAWTGVPLLFALGGQALGFDGSPQRYVWNVLLPAFVQLYAVVYLLLYIGNRLRMRVLPHDTEDADHAFLRLPALTVAIPLALALYFAQHQFKTDAEFAICALLMLAVFGVGYFIRPYRVEEPGTVHAIEPPKAEPPFIETEQVLEQQAAIELPPEPEPLPVPSNSLPAVIPQSTEVLQPMQPLEGIVLRLKRSQKTSTMGNIIYMLDARIDASQETLDLIYRHSLGGRLIYESEARQKHAANAQGHLANTRGGPSLLAPASEQAMGAAKTMWKLGRAAVSAVRASLALRITVNSLLSGVHVECKDMEELLEAEAAIREAKENLEGFIETAKTFDGREEIH
jgi:hypothetical protein